MADFDNGNNLMAGGGGSGHHRGGGGDENDIYIETNFDDGSGREGRDLTPGVQGDATATGSSSSSNSRGRMGLMFGGGGDGQNQQQNHQQRFRSNSHDAVFSGRRGGGYRFDISAGSGGDQQMSSNMVKNMMNMMGTSNRSSTSGGSTTSAEEEAYLAAARGIGGGSGGSSIGLRGSSGTVSHPNSPLPSLKSSSNTTSTGNKPQRLLSETTSTGIAAFPWKLHDVLEDAERKGFANIVSWMMDGRAFKVHDQKLFESQIMSRYFNQTMYKSFQRQLNIYGFQRVTSGESKGSYTHDLLVRGKPDICRFMVRTKIKKKGSKSGGAGGLGGGSSSHHSTGGGIMPPGPGRIGRSNSGDALRKIAQATRSRSRENIRSERAMNSSSRSGGSASGVGGGGGGGIPNRGVNRANSCPDQMVNAAMAFRNQYNQNNSTIQEYFDGSGMPGGDGHSNAMFDFSSSASQHRQQQQQQQLQRNCNIVGGGNGGNNANSIAAYLEQQAAGLVGANNNDVTMSTSMDGSTAGTNRPSSLMSGDMNIMNMMNTMGGMANENNMMTPAAIATDGALDVHTGNAFGSGTSVPSFGGGAVAGFGNGGSNNNANFGVGSASAAAANSSAMMMMLMGNNTNSSAASNNNAAGMMNATDGQLASLLSSDLPLEQQQQNLQGLMQMQMMSPGGSMGGGGARSKNDPRSLRRRSGDLFQQLSNDLNMKPPIPLSSSTPGSSNLGGGGDVDAMMDLNDGTDNIMPINYDSIFNDDIVDLQDLDVDLNPVDSLGEAIPKSVSDELLRHMFGSTDVGTGNET